MGSRPAFKVEVLCDLNMLHKVLVGFWWDIGVKYHKCFVAAQWDVSSSYSYYDIFLSCSCGCNECKYPW